MSRFFSFIAPTARGFPPDEAIFCRNALGIASKKWCPAGGKDPLFGRVDGFQIDPNKMISSFYLSRFTADRLGGGKKCIDFVFSGSGRWPQSCGLIKRF